MSTSGGNPVPAAGLIVDGGTGTSDTVSIVGSSGNDATTLSSGGSVNVNGGQFGYSNIEAMSLSLGAAPTRSPPAAMPASRPRAAIFNITGGGTLAIATGSTLPNFADVNVTGATLDLAGTNQTIDSLNGSGIVTDNGSAATLAGVVVPF